MCVCVCMCVLKNRYSDDRCGSLGHIHRPHVSVICLYIISKLSVLFSASVISVTIVSSKNYVRRKLYANVNYVLWCWMKKFVKWLISKYCVLIFNFPWSIVLMLNIKDSFFVEGFTIHNFCSQSTSKLCINDFLQMAESISIMKTAFDAHWSILELIVDRINSTATLTFLMLPNSNAKIFITRTTIVI